MKVLIGCEESGTVSAAFRKLGHEAWSCDLQPTRGNPEYHIQGDVYDAVNRHKWDLIILHPDCTALAVSGNRWYGKGQTKHEERLQSIDWTLRLWQAAKQQAERVCLENPVSVIFSHIKNVQYIQPWQFGHGETKKTGLALHNLPPLTPTKIVDGREQRVFKMPPGPNRKRDRSKTFQGVADAMANQWNY
ncbi:MAG: DNA cytosine methyltransferase [Akkermansiaceae bacterium]